MGSTYTAIVVMPSLIQNKLVLLKNTCNHFHNILRLLDVLPNFPLTTSETMWEYDL